jgi:serine/threonine-protein kinase
LSHPGIATVHDYGEDVDGDRTVPYLVMELVPGDPLSDVIRRHGPLGAAATLLVVTQVAEALGAAHRAGVVHRDVKPGNVLVSGSLGQASGGDVRVKVTDFGISGPALASTAGTTHGTPQYMSPEQARAGTLGPSSDVFSLGVVAHEMLTGLRPFVGVGTEEILAAVVHDPAPSLPETVPAAVRDVVEAALRKDPSERPADGVAFAALARRARVGLEDTPTGVAVPRVGEGAVPGVAHDGVPAGWSQAPTAVDVGPATLVAPDGALVMPPTGRQTVSRAGGRWAVAVGLLVFAGVGFMAQTLGSSDPRPTPSDRPAATPTTRVPRAETVPTTTARVVVPVPTVVAVPAVIDPGPQPMPDVKAQERAAKKAEKAAEKAEKAAGKAARGSG